MSIEGTISDGGLRALEIEQISVRLEGESRPVLDGLDLELRPGSVIGISGRSGAGKSTLVHAISGLVPWFRPAEIKGRINLGSEALGELDPGQRAHLLGTCLDRPEAQLFLPRVDQEVSAATRLYGAGSLSSSINRALGVTDLGECRVSELSSGQRQRVALAAALAACPRPVVLDEPTAHLDSQGIGILRDLLSRVAAEGGSVVLTEQAGWRLGESVGRWFDLDGGVLQSVAPPSRPVFDPPPPCGGRVVLSTRGLSVRRGGQRLIENLDLELEAGEIVMISGPNGSGKSTLAQVLAGVRRPHSGRVNRSDSVALMLPTSQLQLFARTVASEVSSPGRSYAETARVLRRHRLDHLGARAPWTLSRGERQRLVHAALDLMRPEVMIVDEPGQGLDPDDLGSFIDLIHRRAEKGRAYLVISHRLELAGAAHRHLQLKNGCLEEVGP